MKIVLIKTPHFSKSLYLKSKNKKVNNYDIKITQ